MIQFISKIVKAEKISEEDEGKNHQIKSEARKALLNLFRLLERIESFLNINLIAIKKISKKFDKKIKSPESCTLSEQVFPYVEKMEMRHKTLLTSTNQELDKVGKY